MGVTQEAAQQIGLALHRARGGAGTTREGGQVEGGIVGERIGLQVGPQVFDRVELRGVRRQVREVRRVRWDTVIDQLTEVRLEAIPDEHDRAVQLLLQLLEELHDPHGVDVGIGQQPEVQADPIAAGRDAQRGDGGDLAVATGALPEHRGVPAQTPGAPYQRGHQQARFVEKDQRRAQARSVFFTRGQSCSIQARMRSSSRSMARRVGCCGENPRPCRIRLTCAG